MARRGKYSKAGPLGPGGIYKYQLSDQAQAFTPAEARAEYARLRREANRRLEVLGRSDFQTSQAYKNWSQGFGALDRGASERTVRKSLYDVARFLNLKTSSLQGAKRTRRAFVESMQDRGYDWVNMSNAEDVGKFLGAVQKDKASRGYDSEQLVELFHMAVKKRIDTKTLAKDFEFWLEHYQELEDAPRSTSTISSEAFADRIGLTID